MKKHIITCFFVLFLGFHFLSFGQNSKNISSKVLPTKLQDAYDVKWYFLNIQAENNTVALSGDVTIKAQVTKSVLDTFSFHLHKVYTIDSIKVNGVAKSWINNNHEHWITDLNFGRGELFSIQIFYRGMMSTSGTFFSSITTQKDPASGFNVTWTVSAPNSSYEWFPVKQDLNDKADSVWVFVTTSDTNKVGSNGLLTAVTPLPDNKVRYEWKSHYPIAYYLISIAIANYQEYSVYAKLSNTLDSVLIQNFIYNTPACLNENIENMDRAKDILAYFSEIFGIYPFRLEKYGHCLAPLSGGMENQTMTTLGLLNEGLVAHEMAHQWFGDNVTCSSWEHVWLNEGFATYCALLWNEHRYGRQTAFLNFYNNEMHEALSRRTGSVYVPLESIDDIYRIFNSALSYSKGASILHLLRFELDSDDLFFQILQTYLQRFADKTASSDDFKEVAEELSGRDFTVFFNQWFYGEGFPTFAIKWEQSNGTLYLESKQTTSASNTPLFKMPFELKIHYSNSSSENIKFYQDTNLQIFTYTLPQGLDIQSIEFDPEHWLLAKNTISQGTIGFPINITDIRFSVYPNPADKSIHIQFDDSLTGEKTIKLINTNAKIILNKATTSKSLTLDVSTIPSGIYYLQISHNKQTSVQKIIKIAH